MPDLLGATNPVPGYDQSAVNRNLPVSPENVQIQNVTDPSRVVRADGRTEQQDGGAQSGGLIRYDSNFQTFLQRLRATPGLVTTLTRLFSQRGTVVLSGLSEGTAAEMGQLLEMLQMDEAGLLDFMKGQFRLGSRFGGPLMAVLRSAYAKASSEAVRSDILQFLKAYADHSSTPHIEQSLLRNIRGMADTMPASWGQQLDTLLAELQNSLAAGDREGTIALLQKNLFPFMSTYVETTHDMGAPRALLSLLTLDLARYENGSEKNVIDLFRQLSGYGTLKNLLGNIDDASLLQLLQQSVPEPGSKAAEFAEKLANTAAGALRGEGSAEVQQAFQNLVNAILINESVYMPVNHYILPLQQDGRMLFSELWVDPSDEQGANARSRGGRGGIRCLFKLDVEGLGLFDVVLAMQEKNVEMAVLAPEKVASFAPLVERAIGDILTRCELNPTRVTVQKMQRPLALTEVFPKIYEGRNSVNVKA
ncbi:MAG: hypothetical protein IJF59_03840 [Clostridia bacterium]|nr:hypothetical protein [Clostridia bacterium]